MIASLTSFRPILVSV